MGRQTFQPREMNQCADLFIAWVSLPVVQSHYGPGYGMAPQPSTCNLANPSYPEKEGYAATLLSRLASASLVQQILFLVSCSGGDPWEEESPPQSRCPRGIWALPLGSRVGNGYGRASGKKIMLIVQFPKF